MANILIVDDHVGLTEVLARELDRQGHDVRICARPEDVDASVRSDIALVDILFENSEWTGLTALTTLSRSSPDTALVLFTTPGGGRSVLITEAFRRFDLKGALSKTQPGAIEECLEKVLSGQVHIDVALMPYRPSKLNPSVSLTSLMDKPVHREILFALLDGATEVREIAKAINKKQNSVSQYLKAMRNVMIATGYLVQKESMSIGDWVAFVTRHEDFIRAESLRIEFGENGL